MLNNITKNLTSNRQEVKGVKGSRLEQLPKAYAFCGICRKSVSKSEYQDHKEIHVISKFQRKYNNRKSYLNGYLDRLNLTAQLKLNQLVRPMLKIPKVNQHIATNQKADYLGRAILNTHTKLASESYW